MFAEINGPVDLIALHRLVLIHPVLEERSRRSKLIKVCLSVRAARLQKTSRDGGLAAVRIVPAAANMAPPYSTLASCGLSGLVAAQAMGGWLGLFKITRDELLTVHISFSAI